MKKFFKANSFDRIGKQVAKKEEEHKDVSTVMKRTTSRRTVLNLKRARQKEKRRQSRKGLEI